MDVKFTERGVQITVLDGPYLEGGELTGRAVTDYRNLLERLDELKGFAADKLLKPYNDTWLDDDIGELDRAGFMARLENPSIHLYDDLGATIVYFEDGGLFAGHTIQVNVDDGQPVHAQIVG
jgi:hypothetical protein